MAQTIFFDLDGTLTDPMVGITGSIQYAMEKLGVDVPTAEDLLWCIGPPLLENFRTLVGDDRAPAAVAHYRERFSTVGLYENTPYSGIHDALSKLQNAEIRLCVASSKPHVYVRQILEHFELIPYFTDVFGSELNGTRTDKSELLRYALSEARVDASEATMVGDRKHDIVGALDNGLSTVGVLYGYGSSEELTQAGAHRFANAPSELVSMLL
ncbi:MAG: HAD family hydrolase [Gammaproteobacteria bacterium]|nr:MAG: HAD family hydrolase [Gammaproteobacteria bacterium]